jgi:type VI secretion system secreted protein VgrG
MTTSTNLAVTIASGDALDVRDFSVHEAMSSLFTVTLTCVAENPDIDFEAVVGKEASFTLHGRVGGGMGARTWTGICDELHLLAVEEAGLSTYHVRIVPSLWLATQRRNHRMFQQLSELEIVEKILGEWGIEPEKRLTATYKKRKYRVQYGESDYAFVSRMLEDAGISFHFTEADGATKLVLSDAPQKNEARAPKIAFIDEPTVADKEHVTAVRVGRRVRPGRYTLRDHDYRRPPSYKLMASAAAAGGNVEDRLERFHYTPGAFLFESETLEDSPHADDKGRHRADEGEGEKLAEKRLAAKRGSATTTSFQTNVIDLSPGVVMSMLDHPRRDLGPDERLLVVESSLHGARDQEFVQHVEAQRASVPYRPKLTTKKPRVQGVESATVVGPPGEEIHTDEFGRVRVHFHWDRESKMDDNSSCWIHVSQPWGGAGFGGVNLPRVGQEVLVDFLGGDPDRPVIVGRLYTNVQKVPYKLPANKTQSGWKSNSTNQTGGYNELMFEDAAGNELVRMQAERDMHKLVKHDEQHTVGNNRTRVVHNDESVTIGNDRTKTVKRNEDLTVGQNLTKSVIANERETTGVNRTITVGVNRTAQIGAVDSTMVGQTYVVAISPPGEGAPEPTVHEMRNDRIAFTTPGGASIVLEGDKVTISASTILVTASSTATMTGQSGLNLSSAGGDVKIDGGPMVKINT